MEEGRGLGAADPSLVSSLDCKLEDGNRSDPFPQDLDVFISA